MRLLRLSILVTSACAAIAACGTKGPLYVPGIPVTAQWPYPKQPPAPVAPVPKPADVPATSEDKK